LKFLHDPHKTLTNLLFLRKSASVATCRLRIFTLLLPIIAGVVALDVLGNRKEQLFFIPTLADFSSFLRNAVSVILAVFLII
jgi:hypothetical protein